MAWNAEHKINTRQRILHSAARLFTQHGFDKISIDNVMTEAGLTRGAFYAHFKTKSELYAEAIIAGAKQKAAQYQHNADDIEQMSREYLSSEHLQGEQLRCPLAFLTTDIGQRDKQVRDAYTAVFKGLIRFLESAGMTRVDAMQRAVLMIGGVAIAKALNQPELVNELLDACQMDCSAAIPE
ncbi:TetR/AcrR family transcriptional regulator [Neptunicella sp. SCSIO 80796]|uniref:TetR/AcrR family transcriptional regulator n=1 Tax=Neptunicella plasticusilytica TaxID=3117012 RepID=UPI003A4D2223